MQHFLCLIVFGGPFRWSCGRQPRQAEAGGHLIKNNGVIQVGIVPARPDSRMDRAPLPVIHEVLPSEVLATIFEEHAKCEWRAPAIDQRVCRFWRQIVLNTPRAWSYLEISHCKINRPNLRKLQSWLNRSGAVPLHIRVGIAIAYEGGVNGRSISDLLSNHHTRIASLRMVSGSRYLFEDREFPCLRLLDIADWYLWYKVSPTIHFRSFPKLRSLRLGFKGWTSANSTVVPLNDLTSIELLVLCHITCTSLVQHSPSLTTLMLESVSLGDTISSRVDFPSLIYLSLYDVRGLKPHVNAPCLVTYHEGADTTQESFSTPLPSLVEYGLYDPASGHSDPTKWHILFPNISRVAIRAVPRVAMLLLDSLSAHLRFLLVLRMICVGPVKEDHFTEDIQFTEDEQKTMKSLIGVRSDACHVDVELCFEKTLPYRIPIFFGAVSHRSIKWLRKLTHVQHPDFPW